MNKRQIEATVYQYFLILILLTAIAYRGGREFIFHNNEDKLSVTLEDIQQIYPAAANYEQNRHGAFNVTGVIAIKLAQRFFHPIIPSNLGMEAKFRC